MQPIPYLFFRGTCEEAIRAYGRIFGSPEPQVMYAKDAPGGDMGDTGVMHAALKVGDGWIYASDQSNTKDMAGAYVCVSGRHEAETRRWFDALAEGGTVEMPIEKTFWSPAFGSLTDRWGTQWLLDTYNPDMAQPDAAMAEAVA